MRLRLLHTIIYSLQLLNYLSLVLYTIFVILICYIASGTSINQTIYRAAIIYGTNRKVISNRINDGTSFFVPICDKTPYIYDIRYGFV